MLQFLKFKVAIQEAFIDAGETLLTIDVEHINTGSKISATVNGLSCKVTEAFNGYFHCLIHSNTLRSGYTSVKVVVHGKVYQVRMQTSAIEDHHHRNFTNSLVTVVTCIGIVTVVLVGVTLPVLILLKVAKKFFFKDELVDEPHVYYNGMDTIHCSIGRTYRPILEGPVPQEGGHSYKPQLHDTTREHIEADGPNHRLHHASQQPCHYGRPRILESISEQPRGHVDVPIYDSVAY